MTEKIEPATSSQKPFFYLGDTNEEDEPSSLPEPQPQNALEVELATEIKPLTPEEQKLKWQILQNVFFLSFFFTLLFTSLIAVNNLQLSMTKKLEERTLWATCAALIFSCAFIPTFMIRKLSVKWTITTCMFGHFLYIAAQFYPEYYTLIPTAIILGLVTGPMWSAKCTYLTLVGIRYGKLMGQRTDVCITRFFAIFFLCFHCSRVISGVITLTLFPATEKNVSRSDEFLEMCGVSFCPSTFTNLTSNMLGQVTSSSSDETAEENSSIILIIICLIVSSVSLVLVAILVDSLQRLGDLESDKDKNSVGQSIFATFLHLKNPNQLLIIPMTIWCGIEREYLFTDFKEAFLMCGLGVHMVGYALIADGLSDAVCSLGFAPLVERVGRGPVFIFGASLNIFAILIMFFWTPNPEDMAIFFFIPVVWGIADAIWQTQINAFYGVNFPNANEAAFSNYQLWKTVGYILSFALSSHSCISTKLYVNIGFLSAGLCGYFIIEELEKRRIRTR